MVRKSIVWIAIFLNVILLIVQIRFAISGNWIPAIYILNILFFFGLNYSFTKLLREFYVLTGMESTRGSMQLAIKDHLKEMRAFVKETKNVAASINEIGDSKFNNLIGFIKSTDIRSSLTLANDKIVALRKQEHERNWITQGIASIGELKQKGNDVAAYGDQVMRTVITYLEANQGAFFVLREDGDRYLELISAYAYGKKKHIQKRINPGEGLAGQALYEQQIVYLTDVPKDYIKITSGLGEATPQCVCILPLIFDGTIYGVIELASFNLLQTSQIEYLQKISENIGYNLATIQSQTKTQTLLEESQKMSQEVRSQEEELRQNMEELEATQEQMKRKEYETSAVLSSLSTVELDINGDINDANEIFLSITGYEREEIVRRPYKNLISKSGNDLMQYEMMLSNILSGRTFSGEFRILNNARKEMWMTGNFTPIANASGKVYKIMVISLFTTQDKEKLNELQEFVTAVKSCFPIAEINPDFSFKTANDLFLTELGIRRLELKKSSPKTVLAEDSFKKVEQYILDSPGTPDTMTLSIQKKDGVLTCFNSTLIKINNNGDGRKKGLLILRNPV